MEMTKEGLTLIKRFEGFRGSAYRCPAGVWTIGYGHTSAAGPPRVIQGSEMSLGDADTVLAADVGVFAAAVRKGLKRELSDVQFSALVSFAYNVGVGAFQSSSVLKAVNAGDFEAVPRRLQLWVKGGGRTLPGLVKRRAAESELFLGGEDGRNATEMGPPKRFEGKAPAQSTTVISAVIAAFAAMLSGGLGVFSGSGVAAILLAAIGLATAGWIIRERLRKSKEEGI
jgi:lysozyme